MTLPLLRYTVLRLALFVASLVVLGLAGARGPVLLVLAALVSLALSYLLLRRPRAELAGALEGRVRARLEAAERARGSIAGDEAAEDTEADAMDRARQERSDRQGQAQ